MISAALSPPILSSPISKNNNNNSISNNNNNSSSNNNTSSNVNNHVINNESPIKLTPLPTELATASIENQRLAFRKLLTDALFERNRRLQNNFGNLSMASPMTTHGVYDTSGNQVAQHLYS